MSEVLPVYAIHTDTVRQMNWDPLERYLPARMKKARQYRFERDQLLCVGAGLLLLRVLGLCDESRLRTGPYGKPYAPGFPAFSLSHSGDWCVLVMGDDGIGVDIEQMDESHLSVAPAVFTPGELDWMNEKPLERFHTLWTLKESLMKATGLGFELHPISFEVLPFLHGQSVYLQEKQWYAAAGEVPGYRFSVCGRVPIKALEWVVF
ncbi:MAG: 4'-phosphopantetheinyl transferase superfamily protein [Clostridia bacterium]|nr:4'-phosphopantetheinyl transferase superfamily protein [Clostridia bacterium]